MIPDNVFSKPIFRKLLTRSQEELDSMKPVEKIPKPKKEKKEKLEYKKKRKSLSLQPTKVKKKKVKIQIESDKDDISSVGSVGDFGMVSEPDSLKTS
jgi:hypothetical protein